MNSYRSFPILALCALSLGACSSSSPVRKAHLTRARPSTVKAPANKPLFAAAGTAEVAEVHFAPGSATLPARDAEALRAAVGKTLLEDDVDELRIVSWADSEYPSPVTNHLPVEQQKLADARAQEIKRAIQGLSTSSSVHLNSYNMATRPSVIAKFFDTGETKVKTALEAAGIANTQSDLKAHSFAGKAIVMAKIAPENTPAPAESAPQPVKP